MFKNMKLRRVPGLSVAERFVPRPKFPPQYTEGDWELNNEIKFRITNEQERIAEHVLEESGRVVDETKDEAKNWQRTVEHQMRERTTEIRFLCDELKKQKRTAQHENDALKMYRGRIVNAINFLKDKSLAINHQCFIFREGRIGVDLCSDEVDRQLRQELKVIKGCQCMVDKLLRKCDEQLRALGAATYLLDEDLVNKDKSLLIDEKNLRLRDTLLDLGRNQNGVSQPYCQYSLKEWEHTTYKNIETNAKALNSSGQLRAYIDLLLSQVCQDMSDQTDRTNEAFDRRIAEMKRVKACLEVKHHDTMDHANQVNDNIEMLGHELADKQRALQLCQIRLSNRSQRPGLELTCDTVQSALYHEMQILQGAICKLKQQIAENKAALRYLLHTQMMHEEEINIKTNSIKIDEVDCKTIREALKYSSF